MAENKAATFETSLKRLEAIVQQLEEETVSLDQSVALFQEGRELARRCETLLKTAQEQIDASVAGEPAAKRSNGLAEPSPSLLDEELPLDNDIPF
jgi:exodeoxyribonuclease VII small subunit